MSKTNIKKHFLTGVFSTLPLFATIYVLYLIYKIIASIVKVLLPIDFITGLLVSLNSQLQGKERFVAFLVFLVNALIYVLFVYIVGSFINTFINKTKYIDNLMNRIPIVKSIYAITKQISDTIFSKETSTYQKVVLIEYPRDGIYSIGLVANETNEIVLGVNDEKEVYNIFIPGTPNPTTGFFIIVPKNKVIDVDYTVEEAFKLIMSAGALEPNKEDKNEKN